ncbi:MAG: CDP-alcohol phosphatidyltransferase family protein [Patescibacteria group bacterium]|jgi:phosphatidylglycerophosphate synthase
MYNAIKNFIRSIFSVIARAIHNVSGGKITPNMVTWIGTIAFLPIAWLIANGYLIYAGFGVILFGLFDTLDGELARLQKRQNTFGMFLDSVTDRVKELLIYSGVALLFKYGGTIDSKIFGTMYLSEIYFWAIIALGLSLLTSYLNAWGEVAISRANKSQSTTNQELRGGFAPFEIRMTLLAVGLISNELLLVFMTISLLAASTVIDRFLRVKNRIG